MIAARRYRLPNGELAGEGGTALQEHLVAGVQLEAGGPAERLDGLPGPVPLFESEPEGET